MNNLRILLLLSLAVFVMSHQEETTSKFTQLLIRKYSSSSTLSRKEFQQLYNDLVQDVDTEDHDGHVPMAELPIPEPEGHGDHHSLELFYNPANDSTNLTCLNSGSIFDHFQINSTFDAMTLTAVLPLVVVNIRHCRLLESQSGVVTVNTKGRPSTGEVWGYGIGFAVLISLISNLGALLAPIMDTKCFKHLLMFLVSMAVGTLVATALLVLIPEALNLMVYDGLSEEYISKMSTVCGALLFFFLSERTIKSLVENSRNNKKTSKEIIIKAPDANDDLLKELNDLEVTDDSDIADTHHGHAHYDKTSLVSTVAYIIVVGDGLHKFVDGLSVGAAFSENLLTGMTVAVAMICEEIAHEIGDIAILLHSGMSMKRALFCNCIAAVFCFFGVAVGIVLGETTSANHWIFAIAGGIFLYVSLVDMLPEMGTAAELAVKNNSSPVFVTCLQLTGLVVGFCVIYLVAAYVGQIQL
ncbi:metal cation symporter ZIP14 [Patella vulgata]|uniref:metal cation symporter ZIP14 n=1 Tax=Patella vulgata TaxID=6465 RepID=UPI002180787B|nr:metal cation symporter ZIP14 [Patella vulgata]